MFLFRLTRICNKGGVIISIKPFCILLILMVVLCLSATAQSQQDESSSSLVPEDSNWEARLKSIEDARTLNESKALDVLIEGLKDRNSSIRMEAAKAFGNYNHTRSKDALIQALGDNNSQVADQAKISLMQIGVSAVVPLISALKVENSTHRANAAQVLGRLGDSRAIGPLRQLQMESNDSEVQTKVAYALRKLDWKERGTS
jgi:HEAT repeat protein